MRPRTLQPLVDELTAAITGGRLRPGDRLPPQRVLAARRGLAPSTVTLAYRALIDRGLAAGEVGRGTFVRGPAVLPDQIAPEPTGTWVDLALNVPVPPTLAGRVAPALLALARRPTALEHALRPTAVTGTAEARGVMARFASTAGWKVDPGQVVFTGSGKQAIGAAIAAMVPRGGRLACDPLTYPVLKSLAAHQGVELVPLAADDQGTVPESLVAADARRRVHAVYVQPVLQNPTGVSMSTARRRALAATLERLKVTAIEDVVYSFLVEDAARLAALAPSRVLVVDSFGKRIAPGLSVGMVIAPPAAVGAVVRAAQAAGHAPGGLALDMCVQWVVQGVVDEVVALKRRDAADRQGLLRQVLRGLDVTSDPRSYHAWLHLPGAWRSDAFEAAAAAEGIAVVRAAAFAVRAGYAPNAVRLALASPTLPTLRAALARLARLARHAPGGRSA